VGLLATACSSKVLRQVRALEQELQQHTGFALYDVRAQRMLAEHRADKYYTPASNTKIFTFYTALNVLGDSAIAFRYCRAGDSLVVWGMGDPSFLNTYVARSSRAYDFLAAWPGRLFLSTHLMNDEPFGPGWSWSEYQYSYQPERSAFPMYSNLMEITVRAGAVLTTPRWFSNDVVTTNRPAEPVQRALDANQWVVNPENVGAMPYPVPFQAADDVVAELLADTLKKPVEIVSLPLRKGALVFHSVPLDSLYQPMMQESDNFLAEQLLLQCAAVLSDTLDTDIAIRYAQKHLLNDLRDRPQWVDGSGLSRYNLFTPRSIVQLWEKILTKRPREKLFPLLATGGVNGTVKNWYKGNPEPYVFGKTGTLSNNHLLSGYLVTQRGRVLIFCLMNNHFTQPTRVVRERMQTLLETIRDRY
jgi:D-alanyl-D-alanine carboxypeptidase/D-alanyl-D-alanine-endopeptidase (penicillin-binding protein 4)